MRDGGNGGLRFLRRGNGGGLAHGVEVEVA